MRIIFLAMHRAVRTICDVFVSLSNSLTSAKMLSFSEVGIQQLNHVDSLHITSARTSGLVDLLYLLFPV